MKKASTLRRSRVLMFGRWGRISLNIEGPTHSPRLRRQIALAILKGIAPEVENLNAFLCHDDTDWFPRADEEERGIRFRNAPVLETPEGREGSRIRFERLRKGLSQEQLALRAGLSSNQLSAIERGKVRPRELTRARIQAALSGLLDSPEPK